jgi:hypothetical protein
VRGEDSEGGVAGVQEFRSSGVQEFRQQSTAGKFKESSL